MKASLRALLRGVVDYAGLFPPAKLGMGAAVENYAKYRASEHAWALGRFIVPVARLAEFEEAVEGMGAGGGRHSQPSVGHGTRGESVGHGTRGERGGGGMGDASSPVQPGAIRTGKQGLPMPPDPRRGSWRISALTAGAGEAQFEQDIETILSFNDSHDEESAALSGDGAPFPCVIDTIEVKAGNAGAIDAALDALPEGLQAFFEIPIDGDPRGLIAALAGEEGVGAKVRTGGITPDAFPPPERLATFLGTCASVGVPFKATAGLHHPVRGEFNLTYEPNCPRGVMFGFLNVFLCAAFVRAERMPPEAAAALLGEKSPGAFRFEDAGAAWKPSMTSGGAPGSGASGNAGREWRVSTDSIEHVRETFALSFGSCSFEEPMGDLKGLGLL